MSAMSACMHGSKLPIEFSAAGIWILHAAPVHLPTGWISIKAVDETEGAPGAVGEHIGGYLSTLQQKCAVVFMCMQS